MEAARRASLAEEEVHQIRGTTDGAGVAVDTTESVQIAEDVGFGELDPPFC